MINAITWNWDPIAFQLGPVRVAWYGICFASAFILGNWIMNKIFLREKRELKDLEALFIYMIVGTVLGARLGHCLFYDPKFYLSTPLEILKVWKGGLASHGGGIGIFLSLFLFCRKYHYSYRYILDRIAITVAAAGFFIRLGNFFNSEIVGKVSNAPWAVVFQQRLRELGPAARHPAQLYESLAYLSIFLFLGAFYLKRQEKLKNGQIVGLFLSLVFTARFLIEFVKVRQADFSVDWSISMGQILSIPMILIGIFCLITAKPSEQG